MPAIDPMRTLCALLLLLSISFGCGGPTSSPDGPGASSSGEIPELTDDIINERINDAWIREVPPEETATGTANAANTNATTGPNPPNPPLEPISWNFDESEPKQIAVVDKQVNGTRATIVLDIKTSSSPRSRNHLELSGQIRTEWELRTGWVLRRWGIVDVENISMKYKRLPKPSPSPSP